MKNAWKGLGLILALVAAPYLTQAQSRTYNETGFTGVVMGVPGTLTVKQGNTYSVELNGDEDDLDKIEVEVKNGKLVVKTRGNSWSRMDKITGTVTLPNIEDLVVSGSGTLQGEGTFNTDNLSLVVSGSGELDVKISSEDVSTAISGSGEISASGSCESLSIAISGSGDFEAEDLQASDVDVSISGSGEAKVNTNGELVARISGSGDVYYKGNPSSVDARTSGSGSIQRL